MRVMSLAAVDSVYAMVYQHVGLCVLVVMEGISQHLMLAHMVSFSKTVIFSFFGINLEKTVVVCPSLG